MYGKIRLAGAEPGQTWQDDNRALASDQLEMTRLTALVESLDLTAVVKRLMTAPDGPKWDLATATAAERRYRRFLLMTALKPNHPFTPARDIDTVWHEHILNTRAYFRDCQKLFGFYLHHDAGYGSEEKDFADKAVLDAETARTYAALFHEPYLEGQAAFCTVSACVVASAEPAFCTVSACVVASAEAAFCTVSACVVARSDKGSPVGSPSI